MRHSLYDETYNIYIKGLTNTADRIEFDLQKVEKDKNAKPLRAGGYSEYVDRYLEVVHDEKSRKYIAVLKTPNGNGDGTVPLSSATALKIKEGRSYHVDTAMGGRFSYNHQELYNIREVRDTVFTAVENLGKLRIRKETGK